MIESLIGAAHRHSRRVGIIDMGESRVYPSPGLVKEILSYPSGTKVGLEYSPKFNRPFLIDKQKGAVLPEQRFYWQCLRNVCESAGHKIVYLENFPTYDEYLRKAIELDAVVRKLMQDSPEAEKRNLLPLAYKLQVEVGYTFIVKRESAILETIKTNKPSVVILGKNHTDYLTQNLQELASRNIIIKKYQTESIDPIDDLSDLHPRVRAAVAQLDETVTPNPNVLIKRTCLERNYKAVTEGRVTEGTPNFIGTWDTSIPARGLFEIYCQRDGNTFMGTIEDCLGSAIFNGSLDENQVSFTKFYDPFCSSDEAFKNAISYHGTRIGNTYKGEFEFVHSESKRSPGGEFTLQQT